MMKSVYQYDTLIHFKCTL